MGVVYSFYPDLAMTMTIRLVKGQFCSVKKIVTLFGPEETRSTLGVLESRLNGRRYLESQKETIHSVMKAL